MPTYEYRCDKCLQSAIEFRRMSEGERKIKCDKCKVEMRRVYSVTIKSGECNLSQAEKEHFETILGEAPNRASDIDRIAQAKGISIGTFRHSRKWASEKEKKAQEERRKQKRKDKLMKLLRK